MLNTEQNANQSVVVLGLTPPYLAPSCHEALYEVDLGVLKSESDTAATEARFSTVAAPLDVMAY